MLDDGLVVRWERIPGETTPGLLNRPFVLPVVLGSFEPSEDFAHAEYDTISGGQFSAPAGNSGTAQRLRAIDLQSLTLDWDAPWLAAQGVTRYAMETLIRRIGRSRRPFSMIATLGSSTELRMDVTLRTIVKSLRPGERDTRYWSLSLKEWLSAHDNRRRHVAEVGRGAHRLPTTATLTVSTTLMSLAREFYGSAVRPYWQAIAEHNGIRSWGASTPLVQSARFKVGDKVRIPSKPVLPDDRVRRQASGGDAVFGGGGDGGTGISF